MNSVSTALRLGQPQLIAHEDTEVVVSLTNNTTEALMDLNPWNRFSFPEIEVRDLATGEISLFAQKMPRNIGVDGDDIAPGATWEKSVSLAEWIGARAPGYYELRALHTWEGGAREAASAPVKLTVEPARYTNVSVASALAGPGQATSFTCLREIDAENFVNEVWVGTVDVKRGPEVRNFHPVALLDEAVEPLISLPTADGNRWIVWTSERDNDLHFLLERGGEFSEVATEPLGATARIVPPLINDGEDTLVVSQTGSQLLLTRLNADREPQTERLVGLTGGPLVWSRNSILRDGHRCSVLVHQEDERIIVKLTNWKGTLVLGEWTAEVVCADLYVPPRDTMGGVFLMKLVDSERYVLNPWSWAPQITGFHIRDPIFLDWPEGMPLLNGVVRVNRDEQPWALVTGFTPEKTSYMCDPQGKLHLFTESSGVPTDLIFSANGTYAVGEHSDWGLTFAAVPGA
jgi:hypothetical protein